MEPLTVPGKGEIFKKVEKVTKGGQTVGFGCLNDAEKEDAGRGSVGVVGESSQSGGISLRAAHGTVLDSLPSYGS